MLDALSPPGARPVRGARAAVRRRAAQDRGGVTEAGEPAAARAPGLGDPPARRDRASATPGGASRRAVHRVLGDLLPVGGCDTVDRDGVPRAVRAAAARRGSPSPSNAATGRCRASRRADLIAGVFFAGDLTFGTTPSSTSVPGSRRSWATSRSWSWVSSRGWSSGSGRRADAHRRADRALASSSSAA